MRKHLQYLIGLAAFICTVVVFQFFHASALTTMTTLKPNGDVTTGWTTGGASNLGTCTTHCDYVDEPLDGSNNGDGAGSYVQTVNNQTEEFAMQNPSSTGQRATNVKVRIYYTRQTNGLATNTITLNLRVNGTLQTAVNPPNDPGPGNGVYAWYESDFAAPGAGWTKADIDALQVYMFKGNELFSDQFRVSTIETIVTWVSPDLAEDASRIYENADSTTPGTPLAATDTLTEVHNDTEFRMRLGITPSTVDWLSGTWGDHNNTYNLQYAPKTQASCAAQVSGWSDVQSGSGTIRWFNNPSVADNAGISSYANDPTTSGTIDYQTYRESNGFTLANNVTAGDTALWDFSLQDVGSSPGDDYCFRVVKSNGSLLESYSAYPEVLTVGDYGATIVDAGGTEVTTPQVSFPSTVVQTSCQNSTATLGISSQKLRVQNDLVTNGWDVSIAATDGASTLWEAGSLRYDFNDSAVCSDGGDSDAYGGALEVQASSTTSTPKSGCTNTGVSIGSDASFIESSVDAISLASADSSAARFCYWDLTGIGLEQSIPAATPSGNYTIDMTVTMTAL